jgi:hypothetical protein
MDIDLTQVTAEEDAVLRRLTYFERAGAVLSPELQRVRRSLRSRDQRREVRPPFDFVTAQPSWVRGPLGG